MIAELAILIGTRAVMMVTGFAHYFSDKDAQYDPAKLTPGPAGFVATAVIGIAVGLLGWALVRRIRRSHYRAEVRAEIAAELAAAAQLDAAQLDAAPLAAGRNAAAGEAAALENAAADSSSASADTFEQQRIRMQKRERLNELAGDDLGGGAYPVAVPVSATIAAVRKQWAHLEAAPDGRSGDIVGVAGRVVFQRNAGKLCFATLQSGEGARLQAMLSFNELGADSLSDYKALVDLGDQLFVRGEVISSRRGELSIMVTQWQVAAKALAPLPNMYAELNEETRVRQRYLDLIQREQARANVLTRARTMSSLRETFAASDFIEVETPMLQTMHGGASARPFVTHSNAFDTELFLRIAPELYLKRAVVGGLERVFEINRNFRNEGADSTHSPEFAMIEAYQAYTDYHGIADLTQQLVQNAALAVNRGTAREGTHTVEWADGTLYDLGGNWQRISMYGTLSAALEREITPDTTVAQLQEIARNAGVEVPLPNHGKLVEELWEHFVKGQLQAPTFVMDFPVETSPLTRHHRSVPGVVEKWDLYVRGFELATGYSELVDPVIQRERFVQQAQEAKRGDAEAMSLDEDFLRALEHAMPPSGGMGMGVDRLLMALTGLGIRETILFPLVK